MRYQTTVASVAIACIFQRVQMSPQSPAYWIHGAKEELVPTSEWKQKTTLKHPYNKHDSCSCKQERNHCPSTTKSLTSI